MIEAAILATRLHLIPREDVEAQYRVLAAAVEKTGGQRERDAFGMLNEFVKQHQGAAS